MLTDFDFAPTHERADYCDAADEATTGTPVSEAEIAAWEANPLF